MLLPPCTRRRAHRLTSRQRTGRRETQGADGRMMHGQVCFLGPELGPLAGLLVGPQMGSWLLEEAHVSSSRTRHTDRRARTTDVHACRFSVAYARPNEG